MESGLCQVVNCPQTYKIETSGSTIIAPWIQSGDTITSPYPAVVDHLQAGKPMLLHAERNIRRVRQPAA